MKPFSKRLFLLLTAVILTAASADHAWAQRTMRGQPFIDLGVRYPYGAMLGGGQYMGIGYWRAEVSETWMQRLLVSDIGAMNLDIFQTKLGGGYMVRFLSSRNRLFSAYAGGTGWVGIESVDPFHHIPDEVTLNIPTGNSFVFGVTPRVEAEIFIGRHFAFTLGGQIPVSFLSRNRLALPQATAGFRVQL